MAYPIEKKLVVGISSNALFDLRKEDEIFEKEGLDAYRKYQVEHKTDVLETGVAYPFIKRFLRINEIYTKEQPVEVVLLSRNSPETGVRIFNIAGGIYVRWFCYQLYTSIQYFTISCNKRK